MNQETAEAEKKAFVSEQRTFAEREGYDVKWSDYEKKWYVFTPRRLRPGESVQYFHNIAGAWEVAAIRAGRKVGRAPPPDEAPRPQTNHIKQRPQPRKTGK